MAGTISVGVVDDHPMYRHGLVSLMTTLAGIEVTGSVATSADAVALVTDKAPDVVLMDLDLGNESGIDVTRDILRARPETAVLVLTMLGDDNSLIAALSAGARGYLVKTASAEEIEHAIRSVADGAVFFGADIAERALTALSGGDGTEQGKQRVFPVLSDREIDVLDLVARGLGNDAIANTLGLTSKTVRNYVYGILAKLDVPTRGALIVIAREAGLGKLPR